MHTRALVDAFADELCVVTGAHTEDETAAIDLHEFGGGDDMSANRLLHPCFRRLSFVDINSGAVREIRPGTILV